MLNSDLEPVVQIRWLAWKNESSAECPPFGLVRVTGFNDERQALGNRPSEISQVVYVNGALPVPAGSYGLLTNDFPVPIFYNVGDGTPAEGERWGAYPGEWHARKGATGFTIVGGVDVENARVMVIRPPHWPEWDWVKPTNFGIDQSGVYLYTGVRMIWDPSVAEWVEGEAVSIRTANGYKLALGVRYEGRRYGLGQYMVDEAQLPIVRGVSPGTGDSTITVAGPASIDFKLVSGFTVSTSGNVAIVELQPASAAHAGVISLADQVLGAGSKTVRRALSVNSDGHVSGLLHVYQAEGLVPLLHIDRSDAFIGRNLTVRGDLDVYSIAANGGLVLPTQGPAALRVWGTTVHLCAHVPQMFGSGTTYAAACSIDGLVNATYGNSAGDHLGLVISGGGGQGFGLPGGYGYCWKNINIANETNRLAVGLFSENNLTDDPPAALAIGFTIQKYPTVQISSTHPLTAASIPNLLGTYAAASHTHPAGDVISGQFDAARLAAGTPTDGYVIKSVAGVPTWSAP